MSFFRFFGLLCLIAPLFGCSAGPAADPDPDPRPLAEIPLTPGISREVFAAPDGAAMRYAVAVPSLTAGARVPLVLALHYAGPDTPYLGEDYLRILPEPAFRDLGAFIIAPDAPAGTWTGAVSENRVLALVDEALAAWPVDPDRVVVTGYSQGGFGTWVLVVRNPDRFSAAIPMASPAPPDVTLDVPVYVIHGSGDELFEVGLTVEAVDSLLARNQPVQLFVADGLSHYRAETYVDALRNTIPWLLQVWNEERREP